MNDMIDRMNDFIDWLNEELSSRGWSNSEVARRSGLAPSTISMVLSGTANPGWDFCKKVADALKIPPEAVFRKAGLLPARPDGSELIEELLHYFGQLSPEDQERALAIVRALAEQGIGRGRGA